MRRVGSVLVLLLIGGCALPPPKSLQDVWARKVVKPAPGPVELRVVFVNDIRGIEPVMGVAFCIDGQPVFRKDFAGSVWAKGPTNLELGTFGLTEGVHRLSAFSWFRPGTERGGVYTFTFAREESRRFSSGPSQVRVRITLKEGVDLSKADLRKEDPLGMELDATAGQIVLVPARAGRPLCSPSS
jgi:hypothetical protein